MEVFSRLAAMPITTWNFKGTDPALRALAPTAQDFYEAFGLGNDDKTIATSNLASVGLAAIQGLHRLVQARDAQIETLERELETQRHLGDAHERALAQLRHTLQGALPSARLGGGALNGLPVDRRCRGPPRVSMRA
jgi:hypothetical protein